MQPLAAVLIRFSLFQALGAPASYAGYLTIPAYFCCDATRARARFTASSTSAACPLAWTLSQILAMRPSGPIRNVERTMPRKDLPRKLFIRRAP